MSQNEVAIRFNSVSFRYSREKIILDDASFSLRTGSKITLMGQNGAGKSTLLNLIAGMKKPDSGTIHISEKLSIAYAQQVIPRDELNLTVKEFFAKRFPEKIYNLDPKIDSVLEIVNLKAPKDRSVGSFSGGQQARLLLASALITDPDLLILDEPTNNLDPAGIEHLTAFLINYPHTCIVVSHDADFLNAFTDGVLYLDVFTHQLQQYVGDYYSVVEEISTQIEKERRKNAQYEKEIIANKEKANFFAHKGGKMRLVARRMRDKAAEMEESKVDVRREDKAIRAFTIPCQPDLSGELLRVDSVTIIRNHEPAEISANVSLYKNQHLLLAGPNGIGKTTLLETIAQGEALSVKIAEGTKVGYYRQDFSNLDFDATVYDTLAAVMREKDEERLRSVAAGFLITKELVYSKIGDLSEGQKGLVAFARLLLLEPGLLILDEPTNHINFRHLPVIAQALDEYQGALVLVSHVPDFVAQVRIDEVLDLNML